MRAFIGGTIVSRNRKFIVTFALILSNAMAGLDATIINTALPAIISDLHGIQFMGWLVAIFLLGMAVATPLWSKFGERKGNKTAYITATVVFMVGALFQGLAPNITWFIIARGLMGIGAGGMNTIPFIIYSQIFKNLRRRVQVIGVASASFSGTSIIGPLLGGWIVDTFSWHWVFYLNLPIALLSIAIIVFFFNIKEHLNVSKVDYYGAILMVLGLVSILVGIQELGVASIWITVGFLLVGFLLIAWMVRVESQADDPIVPNRLFKNTKLVIDMILFVFLWGSFVAFNIYIPMWAQGIMGLSALIGGMTQIPGSVTNFIGSEAGPLMQRRLGRYNLIGIGTAAFFIAFVGLYLAKQSASYAFLITMGAFEGFGIGLCFNVLQVAVQYDAEPRDVPIATSFAYLARILSQTFMSAIYGVILNQALLKGVQNSHGHISMSMMNQLSNSQTAGHLPAQFLPEMRTILYNGIHNIMLTALLLVVVVVVILIVIFKSGYARQGKSR
ncbi:MFS transporter [Companilactobacillus versmoldensis]|uniref:Major facilitator transporter n=1 Tax=Companilactobacillus versmoldensis DSM 14857 = KCTC 3814 TaxID=1423815 RepID=A0A0R1SBH4_9LACO|nr:MFS transporter [Companilactobacillus versmoldensis]KRL65881.1 major facilitator transporter [Companilactobacillus versmoldensis DSM 14857 = KCTC 3814]